MKQLAPSFVGTLTKSQSNGDSGGKTQSGHAIPSGSDKVYHGLSDHAGLAGRLPHFSREDHFDAIKHHDDQVTSKPYSESGLDRSARDAHSRAYFDLAPKKAPVARSAEQKAAARDKRVANKKRSDHFSQNVTVHSGDAPHDLGKTASGRPILGHQHHAYSRFEQQTISGREHGGSKGNERFKIEQARQATVRSANPGYTAQDHRDAADAHSAKRRQKVSTALPGRHIDLTRAHNAIADDMDKAGAVKKSLGLFDGYLGRFGGLQHFQKAKGPLEHGGPVPSSQHPSGQPESSLNPSHEQRLANQKKHARRGKNSNVGYFTAKERHALTNYTKSPLEATNSGHYRAVNDVLSGGQRSTKKETAQAHQAGKLVNQAISHAKLHKNMKLHRSGSVPLDVKEGSVISSPRLMSTTSNKDVAARFKNEHDPENASIVVKAKKGDKAFHFNNHGLSKHTMESEVLFGSHQEFHVHGVKVHKKTGHRTVTLATYPKKTGARVAAAPAAPAPEVVKSLAMVGPVCPHFARRISSHPGFVVRRQPGGAISKALTAPGRPAVLFKAKGPMDHAGAAAPDPRHAFPLGSKDNPTTQDRETARLAHMDTTGESYAGRHTPAERKALRGYTREPSAEHPHGDYQAINNHLGGTSQEPAEHRAKTGQAAALINQAISHSKLHMNMTLHRAGHLPQGIKEGDVVSSPRLTSTSHSPLAAKRFKEGHPDHAMIKIKAKKGDNAYNYSMHDNSDHEESEILFGSHHKFHVHKVKTDAKGRRTVTLGTYPAKAKAAAEVPTMKKSDERPERAAPKPSPALDRFHQRVTDRGHFKVTRRPKQADQPVKKAQTSFGSYQDSFQRLHDLSAQANNASATDQHYAWSQYQRLFELNHRNVEALQQLEMLRRMAQRS